ncbi:serine protease inhibitor 42Dd-like [Haematobia irritans]|uniref:serine protease inhibitor 42Dd-like n=1 Tax=Haematobia irritans TaxID=7368 RepID=UPI003F4F4492
MLLNDMQYIFYIILAILVGLTTVQSSLSDPKFQSSLENFSQNLHYELLQSHAKDNIIYSPFSIQTCLAMVRMGADGQTAIEMDQGLNFTGQSVENIAKNYHQLLGQYEDGKIVKVANKVYVMKDFSLQEKYQELLRKNFFSSGESIDFGESNKAAKTINSWVESQTENAISDLVEPSDFSSDTRLMLLSAIYFKGNWDKPFNPKNTIEDDFYINEEKSMKVQMMTKNAMHEYATLDDLDATAVRLPYRDSDLSMVVILPNSRTGLSTLQENLRNVSLSSIAEKLDRIRGIRISLPKFKVEFTINLNGPLINMGMKQMFSQANLRKMLVQHEPLKISEVIHKAMIDVNEVGTTAAAVTRANIVTRSRLAIFKADHPFYYVIMNNDSIPLFQGTFVGA